MVLVDSSVWIEAWRGRSDKVVARLTRLIEAGEAFLDPLIRTELLQGACDRKHQQELRQLLSPIPVEKLSDDLWDESAALYLKLRESGVTLTTMDCLIAAHAILMKTPLWSLDQIFRRVTGLNLLP